VHHREEDYSEISIDEKEEEEIIKLSNDPRLMEKMVNSVAPSIYGHDKIKEAIVLQLAGGCRKVRPDGVITRGDMHMLLIGDPGAAKSQLLKRVSKVAPRARFTSGKGATAAGLTASVVKDEFLGGWSLEAGTLVLANRGFAIIDEMDKMGKEDRSALHEGMEQQCYLPDLEITFADNSKEKIGTFVDSLIEKNKDAVQQGINCEILPGIESEKLQFCIESSIKSSGFSKLDVEIIFSKSISSDKNKLLPDIPRRVALSFSCFKDSSEEK